MGVLLEETSSVGVGEALVLGELVLFGEEARDDVVEEGSLGVASGGLAVVGVGRAKSEATFVEEVSEGPFVLGSGEGVTILDVSACAVVGLVGAGEEEAEEAASGVFNLGVERNSDFEGAFVPGVFSCAIKRERPMKQKRKTNPQLRARE